MQLVFRLFGFCLLWPHVLGGLQVRCMVAILILVGKGHEPPEIVRRMLEVETFGNKPQYDLADEVSRGSFVFRSQSLHQNRFANCLSQVVSLMFLLLSRV